MSLFFFHLTFPQHPLPPGTFPHPTPSCIHWLCLYACKQVLESTFWMALLTQRIIFKFLRLPLKAFSLMACPLSQPHQMPSSNPENPISGEGGTHIYTHKQVSQFPKEVCISVIWKKSTDAIYGHPLKTHHSPVFLQLHSLPSSVHILLLT